MTRSIVRRLGIVILVVAAIGGGARGDLGDEVTELDGAAVARISAIGTPAPNRKSKTEAKYLGRARTALAKFSGEHGRSDAEALADAGSHFKRARTSDAAIAAERADVVADVLDVAAAHVAAAKVIREDLTKANQMKKVDRTVAKAEKLLANAAAATDAARAWGPATSGFLQSAIALETAEKYLAAQGGGGGGGPSVLQFPATRIFVTYGRTYFGTSDTDVSIGNDLVVHPAYDALGVLREQINAGTKTLLRIYSRTGGPAAGAGEHRVFLTTSLTDPPATFIVLGNKFGAAYQLGVKGANKDTGLPHDFDLGVSSWVLMPRPDLGEYHYHIRADDDQGGSYYLSDQTLVGSRISAGPTSNPSGTDVWRLLPPPSQSGQ